MVLQVNKYKVFVLKRINYIKVESLLHSGTIDQLTNIVPAWLLQGKSLKVTWFQ